LEVAEDLDEIAMLSLLHGGNHEEAEQLFKQGLAIAQLHTEQVRTGRDVDFVAAIFGQVAGFYIGEHRWTEAEPMLLEMKKLCDRMKPHPGVVLSCDGYPNLLEQLYRGEGRVAEAERQPPLDMGTPAELADLNRAARQYEKDGLYAEAEVTYRRSIAWVEAHPILSTGIGLGTGMLVYQYNLLGGVIEKQGRNDQAEAIYKGAIEMQETQDPRDSSIVANFDFNPLLNLYRSQGRMSDLEPIVKNALAIQEERRGKESPSVAETLVVLADIYQEEGKTTEAKYGTARPLYERALDIEQMNVGFEHPRLLPILESYCSLLRKMHQDSKAAEVQARIDRIR
jgi:tetratricopeptide (TPR) repeat protein